MRKGRLIGVVCALGLMVTGAAPAMAYSKFLDTAGTAGAIGVPLFAGIFSLVHQDKVGAEQLLLTYGATMGTTLALKKTITATRPNGLPESFPSGHAASAFAGAAYLMRRYGLKYGVPAYAAGAFVGWTRVHNDKHYWRDIAASAAIATVFGYLLTKPDQGLYVSAITDPSTKTYGVMASLHF